MVMLITWMDRVPSAATKKSRAIKAATDKLIEANHASNHSALGMTLRLMIERLEEAKVPYVLTAIPGIGYMLESRHDMKVPITKLDEDRRGKD